MNGTEYQTIDEYIAACEQSVQDTLQALRQCIKQYAPDAIEKISYAMPCFYQNGNLLYFAAQRKHIGFYPHPDAIAHFATDFEALGLKYSKGTVQFPYNKPLPWQLIQEIIIFRVEQSTRRLNLKK